MSFNADNFLAFGGLTLGTIGTVAITKEVVNLTRDISRAPKRKKMPMKRMKKSRYSLDNLMGRY